MKSFAEYLESTTIHGFRYLSVSQNRIEKLAWTFIIGTCFTLASLLIWQSIQESYENPVMTTIETISVKKVPFPAITVDSGDPDPLGYAEKIFNGLAFDFEYYNQSLNKGIPSGQELREVFWPLLEYIVRQMRKSFTCLDSKDYPRWYEEFAQNLSFVYFKNPESHGIIDTKLTHASISALFRQPVTSIFLERLQPIFESELKIDQNELDAFLNVSKVNCDNNRKAFEFATILVDLLDLQGSKFDYHAKIAGFGSIFSYFTKLVVEKAEADCWFCSNTEEKALQKLSMEFLTNYSLIPASEKLLMAEVNSYELITGLSGNANLVEKFKKKVKPTSLKKYCDKNSFQDWKLIHLCHKKSDNLSCCGMLSFAGMDMDQVYLMMKLALQPLSYFKTQKELNEIDDKSSAIPFNAYNFSSILKNSLLANFLLVGGEDSFVSDSRDFPYENESGRKSSLQVSFRFDS